MQSQNQLKENEKLRVTINQQIEEFFRNGGKITKLENEHTQDPPSARNFVINARRRPS
jgi:hypothetical protein